MVPARLLLPRPQCLLPAVPSHTVRLASSVARLLAGPRQGERVSVDGWVRSVRKQKRIAFAAVGDGSSLAPLQVVLSPEQAAGLSTGAAVSIQGEWQECPLGKQQSHELHARSVRVLGQNDAAAYPLQKKYHSPEFLRTMPHLRTRTPFNSLLLRLRSQVIAHVTAFFAKHDFVQTHPPIITSSDCEGAGEVFSVLPQSELAVAPTSDHGSNSPEHFFRSPKYLTVSSQLHLEALAQSVGKVWTLSPTFRAEKSDTPRHLSEFYMLEAEACFVEKLDDVMDIVEDLIRDIATNLTNSIVGKELLLARSAECSKDDEAPSVTSNALAEAAGFVSFDFKPSFEDGLQAEHERFLAENVGQGGPVFVTDYPRAVKPFYMAPSTQAPGKDTVSCFDLLVPEVCELVGGSMREHRLPELLIAMDSHGLQRPNQLKAAMSVSGTALGAGDGSDPGISDASSDLQWYTDLRRFGSVPHGGFGIGFDRLLLYLSGASNIRDVVGFPRCYESLPPNYSLTANMLAGAFAGIAEHSVMYPIDLLKTRMQVANPSPAAVYTGISNAMITITRLEGFRTLWRGVSSVVMGAGPAHAVYFATYEAVKHAAGGNEGGKEEHHPFAAALSGAAATIASDALMNPFDVIKQRMQLHGSTYKSFPDCAKSVLRHEGIGAFYVSYPTTLCMTVPFTALQFVAYESLSKTMNPTGRWDPYTHCTAGGLAGGLAAGVTTPLDVIKTLLQTRGSATDPELRNVRGLWHAATIIKRREGLGGFFKGLKPRIVTTMPSTAICWTAYEMAKAFFIAQNTE
ncbi:mitochondrial carrier domain-containing protein [Macrophomina phaseolina]|uniref:asparagine--tRNA ligase n=1 Tax=Macrophomina phaseolina TaxID=35725 RepID=A0ABQ8G1A6_9PEZI|nr:mitochondrial carrier domain-containing protein [Macrophomina phaseolina]